MHADLAAIVAADEAARRDLEILASRLAAHVQAERERMAAERAATDAQAALDLAATLRGIEEEAARRETERRQQRRELRARRRELAGAVTRAAVAEYLRIVRGGPSNPGAT